jgi:hypothetical protein
VIEIPGGIQLRVVTPPRENIPPDTKVEIHLPPERCRALTG